MSSVEIYQTFATEVLALSREELVEKLLGFGNKIPLDFNREYLEGCDTDKLRHLLTAALWHCQMKRIVSSL